MNRPQGGFRMTQAHDPETDAIELLQRDHDEIRRLLSKLAAAPPDPDLVEQLVIRASGHEAIEEQYFWPVVRKRVHDGARLADEAVSQELHVKHVLDLLDGLDPANSEFGLLLRQLAGAGREHLDFEENRVWPGVRRALSEPELTDLGAQLRQGRRLAPTRPHPHLPPDPEVQRLADRIGGATDRIRDALKGRSGI
jgi:hemerythrin-like domain-containing protein